MLKNFGFRQIGWLLFLVGTVTNFLSLERELMAAETVFLCGSETHRGTDVPTTYVNPSTGGNPVPIVYWLSEYFSSGGGTPERRCAVATEKLQAFYDNGLLGYIDTGVVNGLPVICIARSSDDSCTESDVIVTLPPDVDRFDALREMTQITRQVNGRPLELTDDLIVYSDGEVYINFEIFVERAQGR